MTRSGNLPTIAPSKAPSKEPCYGVRSRGEAAVSPPATSFPWPPSPASCSGSSAHCSSSWQSLPGLSSHRQRASGACIRPATINAPLPPSCESAATRSVRPSLPRMRWRWIGAESSIPFQTSPSTGHGATLADRPTRHRNNKAPAGRPGQGGGEDQGLR